MKRVEVVTKTALEKMISFSTERIDLYKASSIASPETKSNPHTVNRRRRAFRLKHFVGKKEEEEEERRKKEERVLCFVLSMIRRRVTYHGQVHHKSHTKVRRRGGGGG